MNDAATLEVPDGFSLDARTNERWFHAQEVFIAPVETLKQCLDRICQTGRTVQMGFRRPFDESMANGGGPACLRLRVPMSHEALSTVDSRFLIDDQKLNILEDWMLRCDRDELTISDLADPLFAAECFQTLDDMTSVLGLGAYYAFQR